MGMRKQHLIGLGVFMALSILTIAVYARPQTALKSSQIAPADATTKKVVAASNAVLATLKPEQRKAAVYKFDDAQQRVRWSNLPTAIFQRTGLRMGDLSETQQKAVHTLLQTVLSKQGYRKVIDIMNGDEVLKQTERGNLMFGKSEYYLAFRGEPSETKPWCLQFGGHHLAINATVIGPNITLAPSLPAAQPAKYTLGGKTIQPLGQEMTKGFTMVQSLTPEQQKVAIRATYYIDLVLGPGQDGKKLANEGIAGSALDEKQKKLLLELMAEWVNNINEEDAKAKMAEVEKDLDKTYFAWGGPTTTGSAAYYRVTAPTLVLEYSPQRMGGDGTNHTHCIYRDPTNDYGAKFLK